MKYNLKNFEKETIINYNDDERIANVYTCNTSMMRKMDEKCEKYPDYFKLIKQDECSKTYECDKKYVSIRSPRIYTEEQRKQMATDFKNRLK